MFALRRAAIKRSTVQSPIARRCFHASATRFVKVGDSIPDVELMESSPGNKVNLATELKGKKGVIVGVPAAYCKFQPLLKRKRHGNFAIVIFESSSNLAGAYK